MILSILECPTHGRLGVISIVRHPSGHDVWRTKWDANGVERSGVGTPERQLCGKCGGVMRYWAGLEQLRRP